MKIIINKKKISNYTERVFSDIFVLKSKYIKTLKTKADKSNNKSYRILFHKNNSHLTHEMMICFKKNAVVPVHKHPGKRSESYHIVEGSMDVYFFKDNGKPIGYISLSKKNNQIFYRLSSSKFHLLVPTSEYLIYHETVTGPFLSKADIIYPKWSANFNEISKINSFIKKNKNVIKKL
ncbi:glucose-6-phosphate isomerase-like protein [Candidatus Pelagibacter ubique HTCC1002]|uniref:Glucose-6-phosphate isomerase-like protein n=1 Tax=Pelagibacter ubique (strain HTCC1002) TaxID=314261 RepID=Q1V1T4_PELU1|nr:WbuC family cupin fold metalloprotein [Candidatus Pelagibacter ubique]EAS84794.1 glucose-6-phosphate isomerase-like protein [Candidatus Pelagibacter ubique HTCC1002]